MKEIKKLMITLVALLAVTTGAWADGIACTASDLGKVLCTDGSIYENVSAATTAGKTAAAMIAYVDETNKNGLALALTDEDAMTWDNSAPSNKGKTAPELCSALNTSKAVTGGTWKLPSQDEWKQMFSANGGNEGSYSGLNTAIGNAGGTALLESEEYWSSSEVDYDAWLVNLADGNASWGTEGKHYQRCVRACLAFDIAASSGPEVAWNKAEKTGTFTMPGDNVTVSVEYYDLATLADKGLTAAVDAAAKTEAPLAVLAENAITGGTVMYYVAPDANFSQADAIALAETAWSADIPTAETIDAAGGTCYVWYYIKGDDEHSDTDPQRLAVTVLPEPTYTVDFAEGTQDADKWTVKAGTDGSFQSLPLKGVKAGTKVKLKYDGDRSMLKGVKAEKKAAGLLTLTVTGVATKSIYYAEGDTWQQAIERPENAGSGWRVQGNYIFNGGLTLMIGSGYVRPEHTIDATKNFSLQAD